MSRWLIALAALVAASLALGAQDHEDARTAGQADSMEARLFPPSELKWKDGPPSLPKGAQVALLEGDPAKEGPFVFRLKFPDGYRVPPHTHPKTERVTVLAGTLHFGMGKKFDPKSTKPLTAGTFGYWPAGMAHFAHARGETVLQLHGTGPWQINYIDPADDPRNGKR